LTDSSPPAPTTVPPLQRQAATLAGRVTANATANIVRLFVASVVTLFLPAYLARHLQRDIFNIWALVIQVGSFVSFLEIGIQIAVSKFVAEHHAIDDLREASTVLTNAAAILAAAGLTGLVAMAVISLSLGRFFPAISHDLLRSAQMGVLLYGGSLSLSLPASAFAGVFLGLQRNFPVTLLQSLGKIVFAFLVVLSVALHAPIIATIALAGIATLLTAAAQVLLTRTMVPQIHFAAEYLNRTAARTILSYCSYLSIWFVSMLFISGLDTTLVAHFDFAATAAYAITAILTSFISSVQGSFLSPLIPATSALSKHQSPEYLGGVLTRFTRYTSLIAILTSLPFFLVGHRLLVMWVGHPLADQGIHFLWILSAAVAIRQFSLTYSVMVLGLGKQKLATISPAAEGIVNLTCSILLAIKYGAIGVAYGTFIGAFVGLAVHLFYSMQFTRPVLAVSRARLVLQGFLRPSILFLPTLLLAPYWMRLRPLSWITLAAAGCTTVALLFLVCLNPTDRYRLSQFAQRLRQRALGRCPL